MHLNPYGQDAVLLAADLVNDPPTSVERLTARCAATGVVIDMPADDSDLGSCEATLILWTAIVDADTPASAQNS